LSVRLRVRKSLLPNNSTTLPPLLEPDPLPRRIWRLHEVANGIKDGAETGIVLVFKGGDLAGERLDREGEVCVKNDSLAAEPDDGVPRRQAAKRLLPESTRETVD
jgi:hypothetical protein